MRKLFDKIDWAQLREQKEWLVDQEAYTQAGEATGLVHLLDSIQDAAVNEGIPEDIVFGELTMPLFDDFMAQQIRCTNCDD